MHTYHLEMHHPKGWLTGPWDSTLPVSVGYANCPIDEPHIHTRVTEIYLVASGMADLRIEKETLHLEMGDVIIVEPGEAHAFLASSPDYHHYLIQTPGLSPEEARVEKVNVERERLSL